MCINEFLFMYYCIKYDFIMVRINEILFKLVFNEVKWNKYEYVDVELWKVEMKRKIFYGEDVYVRRF